MNKEFIFRHKIQDAFYHTFQSQKELIEILQTSGCVEFRFEDGNSPFLWQSLRRSLCRDQISQTGSQEQLEEPEYYLSCVLAQLFENSAPKGISAENLIVENQFRDQTIRFCISGSISLKDLKSLYESAQEPDRLQMKKQDKS